MSVTYDGVAVGDEMPAHETAPISRHTLALYCGASGDHNPMHVDIDFAKKFGFADKMFKNIKVENDLPVAEDVLRAGHRVFGENRVQEAAGKWPGFREKYEGIELHIIGPLQSNKVRQTFLGLELCLANAVAIALSVTTQTLRPKSNLDQ